jgi:predicted nucleotidyltransferase
MRPDSDIDLLLVVNPLPDGRVSRVREFEAVESELAADIKSASFAGVTTRLSPVFKTPSEVRAGSPLFLDMVEDALILHDADGFMAAELGLLRTRLEKLGARRVRRASAWFWDLKPDYSPGDVFEI